MLCRGFFPAKCQSCLFRKFGPSTLLLKMSVDWLQVVRCAMQTARLVHRRMGGLLVPVMDVCQVQISRPDYLPPR